MSTAVAKTVGGAFPGPRSGGRRTPLGPVPSCDRPSDGGPDDPLRLGRAMRLRLRAAVQALLADPAIAEQGDVARLAAVVLFAKSRAPRGLKDDNVSWIWVAELGRWLGVGESTVHRRVLAPLRGSDGLHTDVVTDAQGHPTGLKCLVMPLWRARTRGVTGHPLALSKAELATLLRLLEALFGHGWTPEGRKATPPGLLAGRTGKGAATDRLGLLLMVLNTRASGWLQLCSGSVKKREGRGAATLARLLGCSPSGARKVLARLTEAGVVARQRKATSTRMHGRGRVMLLPIARAYGRTLAPVEAVSGSGAVFSARPDGAFGDHAPAGASGALGTSGIDGAEEGEEAGNRERPDGAVLHADHASVATPIIPPQLSCGSSGEGRGGEGHRPKSARVREDGSLRGEQHTPSPSSSPSSCLDRQLQSVVPRVSALLTSVVPVPSAFQQRRLSALVRGLLAEGERDAEVAARLRKRLAPLATGNPQQPFAFRRDGFSWAVSIGLPYTHSGLTLVRCARSGCGNLVRGKVTDRVRCDSCEVEATDWERAVAARRAWEKANTHPAGHGGCPPSREPAARAELPRQVPAAASTVPSPAVRLPGPVQDLLDGLAVCAPHRVAVAKAAADVLFTPADTAPGHDQSVRRARATAAWHAITSRYADELAAHHAREAAA